MNFSNGYGAIGKVNSEDEDLNFYDNYKAAIRLQEIIKKENIDLIHINSSVSNVGAFAALMADIPYVWHFREMLEEDFECEFWDKPLKLELISRSNCIISISKTVQESYKRKYGIESVCAYDGIDAERYKEKIAWMDSEHHNFIITGVISPNKGQWDAVKAIEVLANRRICNVHLTLLGRSSGRTVWAMQQYIKHNNLEEYISIVPFQKNLKAYREGNVYSLTTSKMEALGRCTIEAMLAGNIVIGADTGGTIEIIGDNNTRGYLYKQGDYVSLADTMYQAITDSVGTKKRRLENAQRYVEETFSVDKYSDNILEIYKRILVQYKKGERKTEDQIFLESLETRYQELENNNNKMILKKSNFSEIQQKWNGIREKGLFIKDYFINRNFYNIAIYGMGSLGCRLYDELCNTDTLNIKYVIDKNDADIKEYIKVTQPGEMLKEIDILVVALAKEEQEIMEEYKDNDYLVISIFELLDSFDELV